MNNQLNIVGRVGQDPHSVSFPDSGNQVVKFSVAVTQYSSKKDEETTLWIDVDAWNGLGERVMKLIRKGGMVFLTGRLAINTFEKEKDGKTIEVHKPILKLTSFYLCDSKLADVNADETVEEPARGSRKSA